MERGEAGGEARQKYLPDTLVSSTGAGFVGTLDGQMFGEGGGNCEVMSLGGLCGARGNARAALPHPGVESSTQG